MVVARANGCDFSTACWQRMRRMLDYIASIMDAGGHVPNFGDADDAIIARLDPDTTTDVYRSLLATGAVLFDSAEFKFKSLMPGGVIDLTMKRLRTGSTNNLRNISIPWDKFFATVFTVGKRKVLLVFMV